MNHFRDTPLTGIQNTWGLRSDWNQSLNNQCWGLQVAWSASTAIQTFQAFSYYINLKYGTKILKINNKYTENSISEEV